MNYTIVNEWDAMTVVTTHFSLGEEEHGAMCHEVASSMSWLHEIWNSSFDDTYAVIFYVNFTKDNKCEVYIIYKFYEVHTFSYYRKNVWSIFYSAFQALRKKGRYCVSFQIQALKN